MTANIPSPVKCDLISTDWVIMLSGVSRIFVGNTSPQASKGLHTDWLAGRDRLMNGDLYKNWFPVGPYKNLTAKQSIVIYCDVELRI